MKNKAGIIVGFILGAPGFLFLFKIIFLDNIPPEDEVPPGVVVFAALLSGVLFAFIGYLIQDSFGKKESPRPS